MGTVLLGIDIGTSGCKCCLLNSSGKVLGAASQEYQPRFPQPGWVEQDPQDWYLAFLACLKALASQPQVDLRRVSAIGITGQMRGPTFLNREGQPVRPSILWNDLRCEGEVANLNVNYAGLLHRVTHNPLNTMCTLPKLLWVFYHEPETWRRTATLLYPKDYLNFCLTGERHTDLSDASGSSFYDIHKQTWSEEILKLFSITREKLPEILPSSAVTGTLTKAVALATGLSEGIPVMAGGSDATIEMLATGIESERQCKIRLGSSGSLSTVVNCLESVDQGGYYCWSYIVPGRWMLDLNTRACAQATIWLRQVCYREISDSAAAYRLIETEARQVPPGADDLFFHPYLLGEDAPYWEPRLKASFTGLTSAHQRPHIARSVLEGTGYALRDAISVYGEREARFQEYVFVGGGTRNALWVAIVADILGIDGRVAGDMDAAYGAAMLAGIGSGVFSSVSQAAAVCHADEKVLVKHDPDVHQIYTGLFEHYVAIKHIYDGVYLLAAEKSQSAAP
jgi:xylulokinase